MATNPRIFLSAGEASGDAYAAALVKEIHDLDQQLHFEGIGGRRLGSTIPLLSDSSSWGAIGIFQSLLVASRALSAYRAAQAELARGTPGLLIPIDFGFMNVKLARFAKSHGWKVLYFVPPGSWRRDKQGKDLAAITDAISTPFAWSAQILGEMGANAHWFGHPIKQFVAEASKVARGQTIAVLPGSRKHEIDNNLPLIAKSVDGLVEFAIAPSVDAQEFRRKWEELRRTESEDIFTVGDTAGVLRRARAAVVCSGTATLEAALCRTPMVVIYRASRAMVIESKLRLFKMPKYISLPNILLDRMAVPELIQDGATPETVRVALEKILRESPERTAQLEAFDEIDALTGTADAISQTAKLAVELIRG